MMRILDDEFRGRAARTVDQREVQWIRALDFSRNFQAAPAQWPRHFLENRLQVDYQGVLRVAARMLCDSHLA